MSDDKLRAVILAALMVVSVIGAGVSFSGSAVAAGNTEGSVGLSLNSAGNQATVQVSDPDLNTDAGSRQSHVVNVESTTESASTGIEVGDTGDTTSAWYQVAKTFLVGDRNNDGSITTADFTLSVGADDERITDVRTRSGFYEVEITDGSGTSDGNAEVVTYQRLAQTGRSDLDASAGVTEFRISDPVGDRNGDGQITLADVTWVNKADDERIDAFFVNSDGSVTLRIEDTDGDSDSTRERFTYLASETVTVAETGPDTGTFVGTQRIEQTDSPGVLKAGEGDLITAYYNDGARPRKSASETLSLASAPQISNVNLDESSGVMTMSFTSDTQLGSANSDIAVQVSGPNGASYPFDGSVFSRSGSGPYTYTYTGSQAYDDGDGDYSMTVIDAKDPSGNNGGVNGQGSGLTDTHTYSSGGGDTTPPTVQDVTFGSDSGDMAISFTTDEALGTATDDIIVTVAGPTSGPGSYTFTQPDFTESQSGPPYTYTLSASQAFDDGSGTYTATVSTAKDPAGNDGGSESLSDSYDTGPDTTPPTISDFTLAENQNGHVQIAIQADEKLGAVSVSLSGPESTTFSLSDFSESPAQGGGYLYLTTYTQSADGTYSASLDTAEDIAGNGYGGAKSDSVTISGGSEGPGGEGPGLAASPHVKISSSELSKDRSTALVMEYNGTGQVQSPSDLAVRVYEGPIKQANLVKTKTDLEGIRGITFFIYPEQEVPSSSFTANVELVDTSGSTPTVLTTSSKQLQVYNNVNTQASRTTLDDTADSGITVSYDTGNIDPANAELKISSTTVGAGFTSKSKSLTEESGSVTFDVKASDVKRNFTAQIFIRDTSRSRQVQSSISTVCVSTLTSKCPTVQSTDVMYASNGTSISGVEVAHDWSGLLGGINWYLHPSGQPDTKEIDGVSGLSSDTELMVNMTVSDFEPTFVMGSSNASNWETTDLGSGETRITYYLRPADAHWNTDVTNRDPREWPLQNASANRNYEAIVEMTTISLPGSAGKELKGGLVASDAQAFAPPQYTAGKNGKPGQLTITVASPHFETDGSTVSQGYYTAIVPSGITQAWGVRAEQLTTTYQGESVNSNVEVLDSGAIKVDTGIHYSSGKVQISGDQGKPIADAGADRTVDQGTALTLDGSASSDPDGSISSYEWDIDDDGTYEATGESISHTYSSVGTETVTLRVTDNDGKTNTDATTVTVEDATAPTAEAGADRTVSQGTAVALDGSSSTDNTGISSYEWDIDDDGTYEATGESISHTYSSVGTETVTLRVTDSKGNTDTDTLTVTVTDATAPTAAAGADRTVVEGDSVALDGSGSTDNTGISSYEWDIDDDGTYETTGESISHTYSSAGTETVTLRVTDSAGNTDTDTLTVTVQQANTLTALAGQDRTVDQNQTVVLDGSGSTDDTGISSYEWDIDDDGAYEQTGVAVTTSYSTVGTNTVTLRVTDGDGNTDTDTVTISVADSTDPLAAAGRAQIVEEGTTVTLNGAASSDNVGVASYQWDVDGDGTYEATGKRANYTFGTPGDYTVVLRVVDTSGNSDRSQTSVRVYNAGSPAPAPSPSFTVADIDAPETVENDTEHGVTVTVANTGGADGTYTAALTVDGRQYAAKSVPIPAGERATVTFDVTFTSTGTRTLTAGNRSEPITVEAPTPEPESAADVYLRDDNEVSTEEVVDAVTKYNTGAELPGHGKLSTADVMEVIVAFNT